MFGWFRSWIAPMPIPSNFFQSIRTRIREICTNPPRYEHSYYGPIDKILNTIFSGARFLVKPQALLRREEETASAIRLKTSVAEIDEYDDGEVDSLDDSERRKQQQQQGEGEEDEGEEEEEEETTLDEDDDFNLADTSFDSCGTPVVRTLRASSIPDFVVCSFAGPIGSDVVRIVIEIKPDDLDILAAVSQLNDYLEQAESRAATPSRLHGVLIIQKSLLSACAIMAAEWSSILRVAGVHCTGRSQYPSLCSFRSRALAERLVVGGD
ncbi:hypothetical protein HGRIS_001100 [Hohenbuehelia grisea]|uniref:Uncharacterized protein n=1 Tax=Hohenbuehelia grisea TaxID=104357 RepID=A0ABR3JNH0_9AGAR